MLPVNIRTIRAACASAALLAAALPAAAVPTFDKEANVVLASATAVAFTGATGAGAYAPLRMYYLPAVSSAAPHASSGAVIMSATSVDGLAFVGEAGVRLGTATLPSVGASSITGCAIAPLTGGGFRMVYSIVSTTGTWRIHHATSADGLAWANQPGTVVDGGAAFVGSPQVVVLNSGDWRLYYTGDFNGGNDLPDRRVFTARSTDEGATWGASATAVSTTAYETGAAKLTDGRVRLFYTQPPTGGSTATIVSSSLSSDALGTSFAVEAGARLSTGATVGGLSFPVPVRSTDSFRWRLYYSFYATAQSTGDLRSALTSAPAPTNFVPGSGFTTSAAASHAIPGEIFSGGGGQTAVLKQGATLINGTGLVRSDDQNISATFNTQGQPLGLYDLVVTNADGTATTLANAFYLDFPPGVATLTNNLLRPRTGGSTTIDVTIFAPGHVTVTVHASDGRPLRTLFDGDQPAGTSTLAWDGKDASGAIQASGVYLVVIKGPKISTKSKVVLIR